MTAKEYLTSHLSDNFPEPYNPETRRALCAYAIKMYQGVNGYSIEDAEKLMRSCGIGDKDFIRKCTDFISDAINAFECKDYLETYNLED